MNIDASLLREKFVIQENREILNDSDRLDFHAPSTRMPISLQAGELPPEKFIIRTHNMHSCVRIVGAIINNYERHGPIMPRVRSIDWEELWDKSLSSYERIYNKEYNRVSIYHTGKTIFSDGNYHSFLDIIEKCDALNKGEYAQSVKLAEKAFRDAGKEVTIHYDSNVALISVVQQVEGRCSMVLRGAGQTTTFNYSLKPEKQNERINTVQVLSSAADFLEGVQLAYLIGLNNEKLNQGIIEKYSDEDRQTQHARDRLEKLRAKIDSMENRYHVRYRPERPDFGYLISIAEKNAKSMNLSSSDDEEEVYIY
ncbi:MAG: hypothetical protein ACRBDL_05120 [Alphaproteobacteria bacterium]